MRFTSIACGTVAALLLTAAPSAVAATYVGTVIASGLDNPRGLAFAPDGSLYIAEAGSLGTSGPTTTIRGDLYRYAETGSITRYAGGVQQRILTGLPALSSTVTGETAGPQDIAFIGGTGYVVIGLGTDPAVRMTDLGSAPEAANLGGVFSFTTGTLVRLADISALERASNPAGGAYDSNPYHLAAQGSGLLVTDAGSNTLVNVSSGGAASVAAVFPGRDIGGGFPSDAVPTGVAVGPDGAYYVAELTGFPFTQGAARIYRVVPGGLPTVFASGFTNITDIAFGADGSLYVLELDSNGLATPGGTGDLIRVAPDGTREVIYSQGFVTPTGLAVGPDGAFYVANYSAAAGRGEVLRIAAATAVPEPASWTMMVLGFAWVGAAARRVTLRRAMSQRPGDRPTPAG